MWIGDLEADGLLEEATQVWCGVFKEVETGRLVTFSPFDGENYIENMLGFLDTVDALCFHNGFGYDWPLLDRLYGYRFRGEKVDSLVLSRLHSPNRRLPPHAPKHLGPHSIAAWGYRVGRGKPEHEDWSQFSEEMLHRCVEDVEIGLLTYKALMKEAEPYEWEKGHKLTMRLFEILNKQEQYGWLVDQDYIKHCLSMLSHWISRIDAVLDSHLPLVRIICETKEPGKETYKWVKKPFLKSGKYSASTQAFVDETGNNVRGPYSRILFRKVNLDSNLETKDFLLKEGWEPKEWNLDDKGNRRSPKLNHKDPFDGVQGGVGRLAAKRCQCVHRRSLIEGLQKLIREDGRIASRVTGLATTGRAKHSQIVNIPGGGSFFGKQCRKIFTCPKDKVIVGTDSAGCQNRMLAARVGNDFFTKTLLEGKKEDETSIHYVNQRAIRDIGGLEVSYGESKNLNYAFMFGASDKKLGNIIGKDEEAGARVRKAMLEVAPGFSELVEGLKNEWKSNAKVRQNKWGGEEYYNGWIRGLDGRPIFIESEHTILVYMLQSDEAIMMSAAYCFLYKWCEQKGWKWGEDWAYLCWMHDEYQCEVKPEIAEEFSKLAEKAIEYAGKYFNIACPHQGESSIGRNWYDTH